MRIHRIFSSAMLIFACLGLFTAQAQQGTPHHFIMQYQPAFDSPAGMPSGTLVMLMNTSSQAVTVTASLNGDAEFKGLLFDTTRTPVPSAQIVLIPQVPTSVFVAFESAQPGDYSTEFRVSDGTDSDQVTITAHVDDSPGNFMTSPGFSNPALVPTGMQMQLPVWVMNLTGYPLTLTATLSGDPEFALAQPATITLESFMDGVFEVNFLSSATGTFDAQMYITDGTETDTIAIQVRSDKHPYPGYYSFTVEPEGIPGGPIGFEPMLVYELPDDTVKTVKVTNISTGNLDFKAEFETNQDFTVSEASFSLAPNASKTLAVHYTGPVSGQSDDLLWITGSADGFITAEKMPVFLFTVPPHTSVTGGLEVPFLVDFGIVDTNITKCEDVTIKNTINADVTISNILLSGLSQDFAITSAVPFTIPANSAGKITVCYTAPPTPFQAFDVLTFDYTNPAATPSTGSIVVNLVGMPNAKIRCPNPSPCLAGWFEDFPITPIGTEKDFKVKLENFGDSSVTVTAAAFQSLYGQGTAFTLLTQLPLTVSAFDPSVPGSGSAELTLRYLPQSPGSVSGLEDVALMMLTLNRASCGEAVFPIVGFAEDSVTQRKMNPLYPPRGVSAVVSVEGNGPVSMHEVRFYNNLNASVTIDDLELESGAHFSIVNVLKGGFPLTLQPDQEITLTLELHAAVNDIYTDKLIVRSSHEHLNKDFPLYGMVQGLTSTGEVPVAASHVQLSLAPNPASGPLTATLTGAQSATFEVVDLMGRTVATFHGSGQWHWNGRTASGTAVEAGTYFIRATGVHANGAAFTAIRQAVIVK